MKYWTNSEVQAELLKVRIKGDFANIEDVVKVLTDIRMPPHLLETSNSLLSVLQNHIKKIKNGNEKEN